MSTPTSGSQDLYNTCLFVTRITLKTLDNILTASDINNPLQYGGSGGIMIYIHDL